MKIFSRQQIQAWDAFTIENEPVSSLDLMERAGEAFFLWFVAKFSASQPPIAIFCGNGNNGGDGLVIARLLHLRGFTVQVVLVSSSNERSPDNSANLDALRKVRGLELISINTLADFPDLESGTVIIDALFGTGLTRELSGFYAEVVSKLNASNALRVSVDCPSGLQSDEHSKGIIFQAHFTCTFEQPKLAFIFPENQIYVGEWNVVSIQLSKEYQASEPTHHHFLTNTFVSTLIQKRQKFAHKGTFGHALLVAGSKGKMGAAILATRACLRSGSGLATVYTPACGYEILQISVPEAMVLTDDNPNIIASVPPIDRYQSIGLGCGIGTENETAEMLYNLVRKAKSPLVLDADALNLLALDHQVLTALPTNSILTPHQKEFERLFGTSENDFDRNQLQRSKAMELRCFIVLKGAHTCIATPDGHCFYNSTGNPGMATGGSGDVLTGLLTGLLAQGYSPEVVVCLGTFLHGLAGDLGAKELGEESLIAGDLVTYLPNAFLEIKRRREKVKD